MKINRIRFNVALALHDLTIPKLAKITGISRNTISAVRNGKTCAKQTADKLVEVLGADILETKA